MLVRRMILLAVAVSLLIPVFPTWTPTASAGGDFSAVIGSVSPTRMMGTVEDLEAFGTREFHTEASREAAEYIYGKMAATGLEVEHQYFSVDGTNVSNVIAVKEGTDPSAGCYLFGAHYDSENRYVDTLSEAESMAAPGADDDASGVAAIIELARLLANVTLGNTVKFVAFGAEEYGYDDSGGLKGSEHFAAAELEANVSYEGTAILDMIGYRSGLVNRATIVTSDSGDRMMEATVEATMTYAVDIEWNELVHSHITYSDHSSFWDVGYPSMLVIEELSEDYVPLNPYYHTASDVASTLSEEQMVAVTQALLGGILQLSAEDETTSASPYVAIALGVSACAAAVTVFALLRRARTERR